ncbi:MAG: hypothetical protein KDA90_00920 [Planctomycetaceae bacterium]|nr:hypothetical protein [Planctomycetaceae bacterium]
MNIHIVDRSNLTNEEARQFAERKLHFALSRFDQRISDVTLVFTDENGPKGGIDKSCRLSAKLHRGNVIRIQCSDVDLCTCISHAVDRAAQSITRTLKKRKQFSRVRVGSLVEA